MSCFPKKSWRFGYLIPLLCILLIVLYPTQIWAAGSGLPWEEPLDRIVNSIQGPVARVIAVIIITLTGLSLAFGDTSGGFKRLIQIVFGLTIAFASATFFLSFFNFAGGAVISG